MTWTFFYYTVHITINTIIPKGLLLVKKSLK